MTVHCKAGRFLLGLALTATPAGAAEVFVHSAQTATLELRSLDASALAWTVVGKEALFPSLPPGRFRLRVGSVEVEISLEPGESVELRAANGNLVVADRHRPGLGAAFDPRDLPSARTAWSLLETADATAVTDRIEGAGLAVGEPGRAGIHGSSWTQTSWHLGGLDLTDPEGTGTPLLYPDLALLGAVAVVSGQAPVEFGGAGPTLELVPRRPTPAWTGALEGSLGGAGLQSDRPAAVVRFGQWRGGSLVASGPLRKGLGLLLAGSLIRSELVGGRPGKVSGLAAHFVYSPSARDEVSLFAAGQGTQEDRLLVLQSSWERRRPAGLGASVALGYARGVFDPAAEPDAVERLRDGPVPELLRDPSTRERGQLRARFDWARDHHALRWGLEAGVARSLTRPAAARSLVLETVAGLPARLWDYGRSGDTSYRATDLAAWAADRARWGPILLEAGLRFESSVAGSIEANALLPRITARWRLTPALALRAGWARYRHRLPLGVLAFGDPAGPGGVVYRSDGPLVARVGPAFGSIDLGLVPPHTDELVLGLDTRLGAWALELMGIRRRERDLLASLNVGVPPSAYDKRLIGDPGGDLLGPADDQLLPVYDRRPESFGLDRYLLTNDGNALHEGVELRVERRSKHFWLRLGATASRTTGDGANRGFRAGENDQGLLGERLENPNAGTYSRGRLFFDRAYTIKIAATWLAPRDFRLGTALRYQDGQPFARVVIVPGLAQGVEAIPAIPRGRSRFSYTLTVDARLEKGFRLGRGARLAGVLEVFNLLDQAREVEEDVVFGPAFRTPTAEQPPRAARLGFRLDLR